jgi:hypothetical protein
MIDENGNITISFYHGTSSIFLPLIEEHGLGGFNIFEKFNLEELLKQLCDFLEVNKEKSEWWQLNDYICIVMLDNKVTNGNMNFRYGDLYITPSTYTATRYAQSNQYGSEYLTTVILAYEAVKEISESMAEEIIPTHHILNDFINSNPEPILITITNVNKKFLSTERGDDLDEQLEFIQNTDEVFWQQSNFTISKIIPSNELSIKKL